jgi:hypothetical protein
MRVGRKQQSTTDPTLAKAHEAGEEVKFIQHAEHAQLGTITYELRRLWPIHFQLARVGHQGLLAAHESILHLPVTPNADRFLSKEDRPDLAITAYCSGLQVLVNVLLTMQHFCNELEMISKIDVGGGTLEKRMKRAFSEAEIPFDPSDPGYAALREMIDQRDGMEHPKPETVRNSDPVNWDRVPLGWLLTERPLKAFANWERWFSQIADSWIENLSARPQISYTVEVVRGVKSARQFKLPPKQPTPSDDPRSTP